MNGQLLRRAWPFLPSSYQLPPLNIEKLLRGCVSIECLRTLPSIDDQPILIWFPVTLGEPDYNTLFER